MSATATALAGDPQGPRSLVGDTEPDRLRHRLSLVLVGGGARRRSTACPAAGLNIAHEAVDRHARPAAARPRGAALARRDGDGARRHLRRAAARDRPLRQRARGARRRRGRARLRARCGRIPELYVAALGTLKRGARLLPAVLGVRARADPQRLALGDARVLVTTAALYRRKVAGSATRCRSSRTSCSSATARTASSAGRHDLARAAGRRRPTATRSRRPTPRTMALLHFTSGTTGTPKGAVHVHEAVVAHHATGAARARPPSRRRLLVHGRSRAG